MGEQNFFPQNLEKKIIYYTIIPLLQKIIYSHISRRSMTSKDNH